MLSGLGRRFLYCCLLCSAFFAIVFIVRNKTNADYQPLKFSNGSHSGNERSKEQKGCILKAYDPWDQNVMPYLNPKFDPLQKCKVTLWKRTRLENGTLMLVNRTDDQCYYRCLKTKGETDYAADPWKDMKVNEKYCINCDFIETYCSDSAQQVTYRYIHQQVVKNRMRLYQKEDSLHPSVFMFVFDSTSSSSLIRTMTQTNQVLRQYYDATMFYHHNKVGRNTPANAFAIFTGQRITELDEYEFPGKQTSEVPNSCEVGAARNITIIYDFLDQNYVSLIAEDWPTPFSYPNCRTYGKVISDHYAAPMVYRMLKKDMKSFIHDKECQLELHKLLQYGQKFLDTYAGFTKLVYFWISRLSHDSSSGLYFADKLLAEFFRHNVENLKNSFIFVMGDHGIRHTDIRRTVPGEYEDNNPALLVTVPENLRQNDQLLLNMRRNARTHTSHYDVHATLYDIARVARKYNFEIWDDHDFRKEYGKHGARAKSLLRPIDHVRTCTEMEIPSDYCICKEHWRDLALTDPLALKAGRMLVASVNQFLESQKLNDKCEMLYFNKVVKAEKLIDEPILRVLAHAMPSQGLYEARFHIKENGAIRIVSQVKRLDTFGKQGYCTKDSVGRYLCYCKAYHHVLQQQRRHQQQLLQKQQRQR